MRFCHLSFLHGILEAQTVTVPVPSLSHLEWMFHSTSIFSVARGRIHSGVLTGIRVPASVARDSSET